MHRFDLTTGQVYHETILTRNRTRRQRDVKCSSVVGAPSLRDIALRRIVLHVDTLDEEALRQTDQRYVEMVWNGVRKKGNESLKVWKTFAAVAEQASSFPKYIHHQDPRRPLLQYVENITSLDTKWLVNLELCDFWRPSGMEFKTLACLDNLASLFFRKTTKGHSYFDDSVIESLALRASSESKLQHLKMIFVQNVENVSSAVFSVLDQFPALDIFCVFGTSIRAKDPQAKKHGWGRQSRYRARRFLDQEFPINETTGRIQHEVYGHGNLHYEKSRRLRLAGQTTVYDLVKCYIQQERSLHNLPVLDYILGRSTRSADNQALGNEIVFERDWSMSPGRPTIGAVLDTNDEPLEVVGPNKKRKSTPTIRENRMIDFNSVLDGL